jgi:hypothetical protein
MRRSPWILSALVIVLGQGNAGASPIIGSPTGLASPTSTITFNEVVLPVGTVLTNQYSAFGVTFQGLVYNLPNGSSMTPPTAAHVGAANFSVFFDQPLTSAAFRLQTNPGTSLFEALLNGVVVESFSAPTTFPSNNDFFGFQGIAFDQIRVTAGSNGDAVIDNIQLGAPVPEPATLAVFGLMAIGAFGVRRRLKATA